MRSAHGFITMQSGPEIGVASTKAFTAPLVDLYLLAMRLGVKTGETRESTAPMTRSKLVVVNSAMAYH